MRPSSVIGIPLGVLSAVHRNSWFDHFLRVFTVSGLAIASFWLAILLQLLFAMELGWTPLQGRIDGWGPDTVTGLYIVRNPEKLTYLNRETPLRR